MSKEIIQELKNHISQKELTDFTIELCSKNTVNPPGNEYLVKDIILRKFKEMGLKTKVYEKLKGRTNVVGVIGSGKPVVAILGHMDTVPVEGQTWKTDPFKPVVKNGKIIARGSQDSKGSSVAGYTAVKAFLKVNPGFKGTLYVLATADEERADVFGMRYLLDEGLRFDYALVPDGGQMDTAIYGEKGVLLHQVKCIGKAGHGSTPHLGINAIDPLARLLVKLREYDWESIPYDKKHFEKGVVLNIGKIEGGTADNVIPAEAQMSLMWRYPLGVKYEQILVILDKLIEEVMSDKNTNKGDAGKAKIVHEEGEIISIPYVSNLSSRIVKSLKSAAKELKMPMKFETISGQTTAKTLYHSGTEVIMHYPETPGVDNSHMPNEYVEVANLEKASLLYALTLHKLFGSD